MIEDELRSVMTAHESEAPTADGFTPVVRRDRRLPSVAAAVVVIALVVGGAVWLRSGPAAPKAAGQPSNLTSSPRPGSPATCPDTPRRVDGNWVPDSAHAPRSEIVPRTPPRSVIVCAYLGQRTSGAPTGQTQLRGDLRSIANALHSVRRDRGGDAFCDLGAVRTDFDNYLIRLNYGATIVWVAAPGSHCETSTNGRFVGSINLRSEVAQAYRYGVWDTDPSLQKLCRAAPDPNASPKVPFGPTRLTICEEDNGTTVYRFGAAQLDTINLGLASRYDAYVARGHTDSACVTLDQAPQHIVVRLGYANHPDAVVTGTRNCILGPGNVALEGKAASSAWSMFTYAPSYLP
jgi:hypothetical protein